MRILFVANGIVGDNPGLAGGETRFIEIAKVWASQGHEIHLLSLEGGKKLCQRLGLNVVLHKFSTSQQTGRWVMLMNAVKSIFCIPQSLKNFEGVVYSTNEMVFDVFPAFHLKLRGRSRVSWATVVHWLPPFPPWKRRSSTLVNSILFFINERVSLFLANRFSDLLLAVSPMTKEQLREWGANMGKVRAVECGVNFSDIRAVAEKTREKRYDAVFMKRLQAVKGVFDLIDIWEKVLQTKKDAMLLVVGEGVDGERARQIVEERGLSDRIHFTGVIYDPVEKFRRLAESRLFLLPTYEENWAISIGEAMAAGLPVVTYDLRELVDVWKNSVTYVPLGDKSAFSKKVTELLSDSEKMGILSNRAVEFVEQFDWASVGAKEWNAVSSIQGGI